MKLKELRLLKGLSQEALANEAEVDRQVINRIERGKYKTHPHPATWRKIAGALGITSLEDIDEAQTAITAIMEETA